MRPAIVAKLALLAWAAIILVQASPGLSNEPPVPDRNPLKGVIIHGIDLTLNNRFADAADLFRELIGQYPRHPIGYFYVGATLQAAMLDAEDYTRAPEFYRYMETTIRYADSLEIRDPQNAWLYFYEGSAYLYRSFMRSKEGNWFGAYKDAVKGVGRLENALQRDSTLYDAYLGVGSYKYWKSAKANFLRWLPLVKDEREAGIRMVEKAIRKGLFVRWMGRDQLCWILMDKKEYTRALRLAQENLAAYPHSRFFKWTLAEIARRAGRPDLSYPLYRQLLREVRQIPQNNHFNELECLREMAQMDFERGDYNGAFRKANEALRLPLTPQIRKRARNRLKALLKIRKRAAEKRRTG